MPADAHRTERFATLSDIYCDDVTKVYPTGVLSHLHDRLWVGLETFISLSLRQVSYL